MSTNTPTWACLSGLGDRVAHAYVPDTSGATALCGRDTGYPYIGSPDEAPDVVDTYGCCAKCVYHAERRGLLPDSRRGLWLKAWSMHPTWQAWRAASPPRARRLRAAITKQARCRRQA